MLCLVRCPSGQAGPDLCVRTLRAICRGRQTVPGHLPSILNCPGGPGLDLWVQRFAFPFHLNKSGMLCEASRAGLCSLPAGTGWPFLFCRLPKVSPSRENTKGLRRTVDAQQPCTRTGCCRPHSVACLAILSLQSLLYNASVLTYRLSTAERLVSPQCLCMEYPWLGGLREGQVLFSRLRPFWCRYAESNCTSQLVNVKVMRPGAWIISTGDGKPASS